ncbi:MAG: hypothetical protein AAF675_17010 [Pseudomonadota bacterium]
MLMFVARLFRPAARPQPTLRYYRAPSLLSRLLGRVDDAPAFRPRFMA